MFKKAVVCTDLTAESDCLVNCAGQLQVLGVREAVLTHVVDVFLDPTGSKITGPAADAMFERQVATLEASGLKVRVEAPIGHPAFSLEEVRRRHDATLIVVGSHGAGIFEAPFSGSVSSDLMQLSETPVLVATFKAFIEAEGGDCDSLCRRMLSNVLYCTDFSDSAERAFACVCGLAGLDAERITLLHVQDRQRIERESASLLQEYDRRDTLRLMRLRERLAKAGGREVAVSVEYGMPAELLADAASSGTYSLMVIGTRGRSTKAKPLGGAADRVVRSSRTPILLVPAGGPSPIGLGA